MASAEGVPSPETPEGIIRRIAAERVISGDLAVAIARVESTLNPKAHNRGTAQRPEDSHGLFQLNRMGGLGTGHAIENLQNPEYNARIGINHLADTINANPGVTDPGQLAALSQRPLDP